MTAHEQERARLRRTWRLVGALGIAATFVLSLAPMPASPLDVPQGDKLVHFAGYGLLTFWHAQLARTSRGVVACALAFVALGALMEGLQTLVPWRFGNDLADAGANAIGAALGAMLAWKPLPFLAASPSPRAT